MRYEVFPGNYHGESGGYGEKDIGEFSQRTAPKKQDEHCFDLQQGLPGERRFVRPFQRGAFGRIKKI